MNLFELGKNNKYEVEFNPILLTLAPFKKLITRDKSKDKSIAIKEIAFIFFYSDIKSNYMYITDEAERFQEIKKDQELPKDWVIDKDVQEAIDFYKEKSTTINSALYSSACTAVAAISNYLNTTETLLAERDENGKVVTDIAKITGALEKVPKIMANLNAAYTELIKEQKITEGRSKGSREFNMFEDGI